MTPTDPPHPRADISAGQVPPLRCHLLAAEPETAALRAEYDRRLAAMIETPLTRRRRASLCAVLLAAAGSATLFVAVPSGPASQRATAPSGSPTTQAQAAGPGLPFDAPSHAAMICSAIPR